MTLGPIIADIAGCELTAADREVLAHPLIGGVILFSRNYDNPAQLAALTADIQTIKTPSLLIAVDQEGGRVQRFRDRFARLPSLHKIGALYSRHPDMAYEFAETAGWIMASELVAVGVDFSFAPVVDINMGISRVIVDRAFHRNPDVVSALAEAWIKGVRRAGQIAVAKHFPGHGSVVPDSHEGFVEDTREYDAIAHTDMEPFRRMVEMDIAAIMMAHVVYPAVDSEPASLSHAWVHDELRERMGFDGAVITDDLNMRAIAERGDIVTTVNQALAAGCDLLPVCNDRSTVETLLDHCRVDDNPQRQVRLARLRSREKMDWATLHASDEWRKKRALLLERMAIA